MTYRIEAQKHQPQGHHKWIEVATASSGMLAHQAALLYSGQHAGRPVRVIDLDDETAPPSLELNKDQIRR